MKGNKEMSTNALQDAFLLAGDVSFIEADAVPSQAMDKVLDMLVQAQDVVCTDVFDFDLEPIPLGPQAEFVPSQAPFTSFSIPLQSFGVFGSIPHCAPKFAVPLILPSLTPVPTTGVPSERTELRSQSRHIPTQGRDVARTPIPPKKTRKLQTGQWNQRFRELLQFKEQHGHLRVPHSYPPNPSLAQWVKR
jgi:hypothetical protein